MSTSGCQSSEWFTDREYAKILDNLVIVCVDTLVVDENNNVLLGKRTKLPIKDWWIFGGRMQAGEDYIEAAKRGLKREVGIEMQRDPVQIGYYDLVWDERALEPIGNGCHVLLVAMQYRINELEKTYISHGKDHDQLRWFSPKEMGSQDFHPVINKLIQQALARPGVCA